MKECNQGAAQMANLEQIAEIDRCLHFKHCKVSMLWVSFTYAKKCYNTVFFHRNLLNLLKGETVSHLQKIPLVSQARNVVKNGPMTYIERVKGKGKKKENYYLYLFNDLMVIAKKKRYGCIIHNYSVEIN